MKHLVILSTFLFFFTTLLEVKAQQNIRISGEVYSAHNTSPVEFAQVALLSINDSAMIAGELTTGNGSFLLQIQDQGEYLLRLSYIGHTTRYKRISVERSTNNLGRISLQADITQLEGVEITSSAVLFRSEADRRIFQVENMTIAEGGTAIQLLESLPSVQVDEEGSISLRGSGNILIYINGRPTNISGDDTESILEQFPATAIKSVELITNPSARYDAEGVGGIINIILKEGHRQGFNGQVNTSVGTGNKYTAGVSLNNMTGKWNTQFGYTYQYREFWEENISYREQTRPGNSPVIEQSYYTENFNHSHLLRLGTEYQINRHHSITLLGTSNYRERDRWRLYEIYNKTLAEELDSAYHRTLTEDQHRINAEVGIGYQWQQDNGRNLRLHANAAWDVQDRIEYFHQDFFDQQFSVVPEKFQDQFYERPLNSRMYVFEADYQQNLGEAMQLETGIKGTLRYDERSQHFGLLNNETGEYEEIVLSGIPVNNLFQRDENIYAAYLIVQSQNNSRLSYMAGLRAEMTDISTFQEYGLRPGFLEADNFSPSLDTNTTSRYYHLFPSLFLRYNLGNNQDIQASYSRRIRRPGVVEMMPFLNAQDFYNLRLGNPYLEPALTNNYEVNYIRSWRHYMVSGGVFHRQSDNDITRVFLPFEQSSMVTWANAQTVLSTGAEIIHYFTFEPNFDATLTGNYYHALVSGEIEGEQYHNESYSWTLSLLGNVRIPNWFRGQFSANYWGPRVIPQGEIKPVFTMNIGIRRNVLKDQGTISFNVSDLLNSRRFFLETRSESMYQQREFYRESRVYTLSFTWRFRNFREETQRERGSSIDGDINNLY